MKASLRSIRIAPKKAGLVAELIRGRSVPEARHTLARTNKKAARILEQLLESAVANASHNDNQDPEQLVIRSLVINKAQAYGRGVPMARGRVRPIRKFLSHIDLTLGVEGVQEQETEETKEATEAKDSSESSKDTSQTAKKSVQKSRSTSKKSSQSRSTKGKSSQSDTATSSSQSNLSDSSSSS